MPKAKKTAKRTPRTKPAAVSTEVMQPQTTTPTMSLMRDKKTIIGAVIILVLAVGYFLKNQLIVATVNGEPITRLTLISELEKQGGKQTLDSLITKTLIMQEANKQKITVSDQDITDEQKKLEENFTKQGQNFQQLLAAQGISPDELKNQLRLKIMLDKLAGKDVTVTDQEVDEYITKNKTVLGETTDVEQQKKDVKDQLTQQKISAKIQELVGDLRTKAKIQHFLFAPETTPVATQ